MNIESIKVPLRRIPAPNYDVHPGYGGMYKPTLLEKIKALKRFAYHFFSQLKKVYAFQPKQYLRRPPFEKMHTTTDSILDSLLQNGAVALSLSPEEIRHMQEVFNGYIQKIEHHKAGIEPQKRTFEDKCTYVEKSEMPDFYQWMDRVLTSDGILRAASAYRHIKLSIVGIVVMVNDPEDPDWKDHFSDIGIEDPPTAYMHVDSQLRPIKCLVYLTTVSEENGPLMYVLGSNRIRTGWFEYLTRKTNDKSGLDSCVAKNRRLFYALPSFLRKKAEFGNDFFSTSQATEDLLGREKHFTSEDGNIFLVDTDGIHRGGMVRRGKRVMISILFGPNELCETSTE